MASSSNGSVWVTAAEMACLHMAKMFRNLADHFRESSSPEHQFTALNAARTAMIEAVTEGAAAQTEGAGQNAGKNKVKKEKGAKTPRAPTAWNKFMQEHYPVMKKAHPGMSGKEIFTLMGQEYKKERKNVALPSTSGHELAPEQQPAAVKAEEEPNEAPDSEKKKKKKKKKHEEAAEDTPNHKRKEHMDDEVDSEMAKKETKKKKKQEG